MPVTDIHKDPTALTLTIASEWDAPIDRVWQLWADPRQLERWWGPPTYPATVIEHDLSPGGKVAYFMTGPEGDQHHGWWKIVAVDKPRSLDFEDGFADINGNPNQAMPVTQSDRHVRRAGGRGDPHGDREPLPIIGGDAADDRRWAFEEGFAGAIAQIEAVLAS